MALPVCSVPTSPARRRPCRRATQGNLPPHWTKVTCQRFFINGPGSGFFTVVSPVQLQEEEDARQRQEMAPALSEADFVKAQVDGMLEEGLREVDASGNLILDNAAQTELSPWLEMTRWPRYLRGYSFDEVAPLGSPADHATEPLLAEFAQSLDRIVEEPHKSVCNDKVNVFDQARINSSIQRRRAWTRPLMIKLKKSTYRGYKLVWQRLICFAYRTIQPAQHVALSHQLTATQPTHLDREQGLQRGC
ncbi:hypothetical protein LTR66_008219 [Elasticomyces elasticus]|nr:hypothetical protein LTR66_008219 [Elasticomyces elasticus]